MVIKETGFDGLIIIEPDIFNDSRGYFFESFNIQKLGSSGISFNPVQDNESQSVKGVIRGLHYQLNPFAQAKLIRVVNGKILDVALDLRKKSSTYGKWFGIELDSEKKNQLLIPRGFAHGFSVLSNIAVIQYKCDNVYKPDYERGILLNDKEIAIDWKTDIASAIISAKDKMSPLFKNAENNF
jgi:dTDP-4-dehydrorhamnose 3,5-epimerase